MPTTYEVPGVYRQEVFIRPGPALPTGVPGFVGFAQPAPGVAPAGVLGVPTSLQAWQEFAGRYAAFPAGYLAEAVAGFFANGGVRCHVVAADPAAPSALDALTRALDALAPVGDLDLVAVPDAFLAGSSAAELQRRALAHCSAHGGRLAILDALPGLVSNGTLRRPPPLVAGPGNPADGALYFPWVRNGAGRMVPPCGHIAGVVALTDAKTGVFKAPANEVLEDVVDLEQDVDATLQGVLNPAGVNCLRALPGRGIRVWGARTMSTDPSWTYISVRRLFLTVGRWIDQNMGWASFEPSTPALWAAIERELRSYLTTLWRAGALSRATASRAFFVRCNAETNPPEVVDSGQVVTEIGLATDSPAEFVVVRVVHRGVEGGPG